MGWRPFLCLLTLTTAFLYGGPCPAPEVPVDPNVPEIQAALSLVEAWLADAQTKEDIPGLSAAIVYEDSLLWTRGFGFADVEEHVRATPNTIYSLASITKLFTSTMMMQLRDEGKLILDDPVQKYMSSFTVKLCPTEPVPPTFRQLASHTAGLPRDPFLPLWVEGSRVTQIDILKSLDKIQFIHPPGTKLHYSNLGYVVLAHALSLIADVPYEKWVEEKIAKPLGMEKTFYSVPPDLRADVAKGYGTDDSGKRIVLPRFFTEGYASPGGLQSTVVDMAKFLSFLLRNTGEGVLAAASTREMQQPVWIDASWEWGMGLGFWLYHVDKWTIVGMEGKLPGVAANFAFIPDLKLGVILLANQHLTLGGKAEHILKTLAPLIAEARHVESSLTEDEKQAAQETTGDYLFPQVDGNTLLGRVMIDDNVFFIAWGDHRVSLTPAGKDRYTMEDGEAVVFTRNSEGKIDGLVFESGGMKGARLGMAKSPPKSAKKS